MHVDLELTQNYWMDTSNLVMTSCFYLFIHFVDECFTCTCVSTMCPQRPEKGVGSPGTGVMDIWSLYKSSKGSYPPNSFQLNDFLIFERECWVISEGSQGQLWRSHPHSLGGWGDWDKEISSLWNEQPKEPSHDLLMSLWKWFILMETFAYPYNQVTSVG